MDTCWLPLLLLIIGWLLIAGFYWEFIGRYNRSRSLLEGWAERNGYRLLRHEYRLFFKGPYFWTSSKYQTVYYVTIEDQSGNVRRGWVRCGSWFWGLLSDKVDVHWDD